MTSRHSRGGVQTVDPHGDPDRWTSPPSGQTGARHQTPTGGRHGGGAGQQPFGAPFGPDAEATVQADASRPAGAIPLPGSAPSPETIACPAPETPPLGSDAAREPGPLEPPHRPATSSRSTTSSPRSSVTGHRPPGTAATPARWPWLLLAAATLLLGLLLGRASAPTTAAVAAPPPAPVTVTAAPPSAPPAPSKVTLPSVSGRNGAIVGDQLRQLGLSKVQFASDDDDDKVVLDPANWTAKKIEPGAGSKVATDATVVVTMTKKN